MGLMGVSAEIGLMRWSVLVLVSAVGAAGCPSLCACRGAGPEPQPGEPLRLRCGPGPAQLTELKEVDFTGIWSSVVSLNMSGNAISTLSRELHLPNLQKLDLSRNQISLIETDAFYNITGLQRLDLSYNQITSVSREMFKGLANLERLLLAHNLVSALAAGTFDHLVALKQLDLAENQLVCDCALVWLGEWLRAAGVRPAGGPRCRFPAALAGRSVRKLRALLDPGACGARAPDAPDALRLRPARAQLVFEGDALALVCAAPFASALHAYRLAWAHPALACDVNVTSSDVLRDGAAETTARLANVSRLHAGAWTCAYEDDARLRRDASVELVVLAPGTRFCPTAVTADNKGLYSWPTLLLNRTASVPCRAGEPEAEATRACGADGAWAPADTSRCGYVRNVTKLLQQFALLDLAPVRHSALNATERLAALLRENTYPVAEVDDPDDVMFVARAVDNYMQYAAEERELGSALLEVISAAMLVPARVMAAAEARHGACSRLAAAAARLAAAPAGKQKANLAVESLPLRAGFGGATCVWFSARGAGAGEPPRLHCTSTNRTAARLLELADAEVHASVQVPASLLLALEPGAEAEAEAELALSVFMDAALFPLLPPDEAPDAHRAKDYYGRSTKREDLNMEITSPVVSVQLSRGRLAREPPEPLLATLRAQGCGAARAAVWDPDSKRWQHNSTACRVVQAPEGGACAGRAVVALARPGVCALLARAERGVFGARAHGARFKPSHPAVYVGSLLLVGCLAAAGAPLAGPLRMPRRARHALANTWAALGALALLYALGVYQTEDARLCRALGLALHYLTLSALLWLCACARVLGASAPPGRGGLGALYAAGWGGALPAVGAACAAGPGAHAGYAQCAPRGPWALGALGAPAAALLLYLAALLLLARRRLRAPAALSEGTQPTEHVELDACEPPAPVPDAASLRSAPDSEEAEDAEHAPAVRLRAQAVVLALFLAAWASGAAAVYRPLPAYLPYQEDICSILYAVCATVLGTFVLFFYGIARSDVRAQWAAARCSLRGRDTCCRGRSVSDAGRPRAPAPAPARSRSGSRSSTRTACKPNNESACKAGAELNGHALPKNAPKNTNGKTANINLVVLHRQQYRSDNSVVTCPDEAGAGAVAFYNPNQMNVAKKFFKKQRQNVRRNRLELPARRDFDNDSHASLPLPAREAYGRVAGLVASNSKVNNTNIHVGRSDSGIKETRRALNPNLLDEDKEHKSYSTDRKPQNDGGARVVNIYTNVPETRAPQHQVQETRTVSQQCSLEYSSSEPAPRSASDRTLDAHSELASLLEPAPGEPATTDTDSFGQYVDCRAPADTRERPGPPAPPPPAETCSTNASEQGFENESDIYCPNYQVSEVSIRSHGLYAPSPASMCATEVGLSAEDVSPAESQYANLEPGWRAPPAPRSPDSAASDLDELYTRIAGRAPALHASAGSDRTLRADSDACSDALSAAETAV